MAKHDLASLTQWITAEAQQHGAQLHDRVMARLSCSRRSAQGLLRKLEAAQWLQRTGIGRKARYEPGTLRQVVHRYNLAGLQEDLPWARDFAPFFNLPPQVARLAQHAFTELLNNAIDHSGGTQVAVSLRQTALHLQLLVSDDGCGLFQRLQQNFGIEDADLAMLELSKGKLTTAPQAHTGRGLFFSARLADVCDLHANRQAYQYRGWERRSWFRNKALPRQGTSVYLAFALDTTRTLDHVLRQHSASGQGYGFDTTQVPLQLVTGLQTGLESRAQAKRVATRLEQFKKAEVDFTGVAELGHAFADELFRVYAQQHPGVQLVPTGMAPRVAAMVDSVRETLI
jgi:anti-sigma regulatory factor (Ser/Thr protein kinase)